MKEFWYCLSTSYTIRSLISSARQYQFLFKVDIIDFVNVFGENGVFLKKIKNSQNGVTFAKPHNQTKT